MIFHSIRWRLQAWHGLILVVVLTGFGFTAYHVARDNQMRRIDQDLDQRLMALLRPQPPDRPPDRPPDWQRGGLGQRGGFPPNEPRNERAFGSPDFLRHMREAVQQGGALEPSQTNIYYYVMWQQGGSILAHSPGAPEDVPAPEHPGPQALPVRDALGKPTPPGGGPPMLPVARARGQLRELFRFGPLGDCVLVGRSIAPDLAAMRRLALWLIVAGTAVLLLGLAGGWWLTRRALTPVVALTANAMEDDRRLCLAADMDDYMTKPVTRRQLGAMLVKWTRATKPIVAQEQTPVAVTDTGPAIDTAALAALAAGSNDPAKGARLLARVVRKYLETSPALVDAIKTSSSDFDTLARSAHTLKSSSAYIGALHLSELCKDLERRARGAR